MLGWGGQDWAPWDRLPPHMGLNLWPGQCSLNVWIYGLARPGWLILRGFSLPAGLGRGSCAHVHLHLCWPMSPTPGMLSPSQVAVWSVLQCVLGTGSQA